MNTQFEKSLHTPTIEQIFKHTSVRKYKPDPLPQSLIEAILAAGQRSSTSSNLQMYSVVVTIEAAKRARLAEICGNQKHIQEAPVFLTWCADLSRLDRISQARGYKQVSIYVENFLLAAVDAALAMQTAALAAESFGLGMCYIGTIRNQPQEVIEMLALPRLVFPLCGMTLGWPATEPKLKPRLPLGAVMHWEAYDWSTEAQALREYDQVMAATGIYEDRQVTAPGKGELEVEEYGWQEHSARRVSQPRRTGLRQALEAQGFLLE